MTSPKSLFRSLALLSLCLVAVRGANAVSITSTGTFANDNDVFNYNFSNTSTQSFNFFTTSYGGGSNANGTRTNAGGFVPVLTLFSSTTGNVLGFSGGDGMCHGSAVPDSTTNLCEDANFTQTLGPGSYLLALTEFPNVAIGSLADGFLAGSDTHFTGTVCNGSSSKFLQVDVAPCVQRTGNYALNVNSTSTSPVPEPPTWLLVLPSAAAIGLFARRQLA